jgi:hypothetical protein
MPVPVQETPTGDAQQVREIALKIVDIADQSQLSPTVLINAMGMAFMGLVAGSKEDGVLTEEFLAQAVSKFTTLLVRQARFLLESQEASLTNESNLTNEIFDQA